MGTVVEGICARLTKKSQDLTTRRAKDTDMKFIVRHLVYIFEISTSLSNSHVRQHGHQIVQDYLNEIRNEINLTELANALLDAGFFGSMIVQDFEQFKQHIIDRINKKIAGYT